MEVFLSSEPGMSKYFNRAIFSTEQSLSIESPSVLDKRRCTPNSSDLEKQLAPNAVVRVPNDSSPQRKD